MGSENSTQNVKQGRGSTVKEDIARASSPQSSICSDTDVPYVSYPINQPIGESPKHKSKSFSPLRSNSVTARNTVSNTAFGTKQKRERMKQRSTTVHEVVVVRKAASEEDTLDNDPELNRLSTIPTFLPIMRGALNIPVMRDPEVQDKLDYTLIFQLCSQYQRHLRLCAKSVSTEQNNLSKRIQEIDFNVSSLMNLLTEEQKKMSSYVEKLSKVNEISSAIAKCHKSMNDVMEAMQSLNEFMPAEDQLEPFTLTNS